MSRRKMMLLAGFLAGLAVAVGVFVPEVFSPLPGYVDEMRACLEIADEEPQSPKLAGDTSQPIEIAIVIFCVNNTKCRKTLLADGAEPNHVSHGIVKEKDRFWTLHARLREWNASQTLCEPRAYTRSGQPAIILSGGELSKLAPDGTSVITELYGTKVEILPTLLDDGRIMLQVNTELSELVFPGGSEIGPVAHLKASFTVADGQTGFVGGVQRKSGAMDTIQVPGLSKIPALASWLSFTREVEFDEELLILMTPTRFDLLKR